jgi:hypothetical protein
MMSLARPLLNFEGQPPKPLIIMKKPLKKASRANYSLGDLILAVSSYSRNSQETVAAVADLLDTGRVRLASRGHTVRARVY